MEDKNTTKLSASIFQKNPDQEMISSQAIIYKLEMIFLPKEGGIETWCVGVKHKRKGYPFSRVVEIVCMLKKWIIVMIRMIFNKPLKYFVPLLILLPHKLFYKVLFAFLDGYLFYCKGVLAKYYLFPDKFCYSGAEIYRVGRKVESWFNDKAIKERIYDLTMFICMLWEFDDAYRYRGQDGFGYFNLDSFLKNPIKELTKTLNIIINHEPKEDVPMRNKWKMIINILTWVTKWKIGKKEMELIKRIAKEVDWKKIKLDEEDIYHNLERKDYNILGISYDERLKRRIEIDKEPLKPIKLKTGYIYQHILGKGLKEHLNKLAQAKTPYLARAMMNEKRD